MQQSDAENRIKQVVKVGAAYRSSRDSRDVLALLFSVCAASAAISAAVYATITARWSTLTAAIVVVSALAAVVTMLVPWRRFRPEWQLLLYWVGMAVIVAAVYAFEIPTLGVLLLLPMMALTANFWEQRAVMVLNLAGAAVLYTLPIYSGDAHDAASALIITLPAIITVALFAGGLAARFNVMRRAERARYKATIEALSTALTARDGYTGEHSHETLWLVDAISEELRLSTNAREYVADVALLHDIGKIGIPNEILHEPGRLNDEQWEVMKQHPVIGERIVVTVPGLEEVARAIRHEHERWDGGGYPDGLKAGEIPLASRIVLVCDAFHAMTSDRPYRKAMSVEDARLELARNAGTQFDPTVVGALLHVLDRREAEQRNATAASAPNRGGRTVRMSAATV